MAQKRVLFHLLLIVVGIVALLCVAETLVLTLRRPPLRLAANQRATALLFEGFHSAEADARGGYRWTQAHSTIRFPLVGCGAGGTGAMVAGIQIGPFPSHRSPPDVMLGWSGSISTTLTTDNAPRLYQFLVPRQHMRGGSLGITLASETTVVGEDPRPIGVRVEAVTLAFPGAWVVRPTLAIVALQAVVLVFCALLLWQLVVPPRYGAVVLAVVGVLLLVLFCWQGLLMGMYLARLAVALALLTLLTALLLPLALRHAAWIAPPRLMRVLWGIMLLACLIRLVGSLYPLFSAYDLSLNVGRLYKTLFGTLIDTNKSIEFRNGVTIYPAGPYLLFLPWLLVGVSPAMAVQAGVSLIDGAGALLVAAIARTFGSSSRTAIFSALLYAAIPINLTALWWGLSAQIFGQALMLPLVIALIVGLAVGMHEQNDKKTNNTRFALRPWVLSGVLLSMALLSHIGVAILAVAWLGLAWLWMRLRQTVSMAVWWRFTGMLVVSGIVGFALVYSVFLALKLEQAGEVSEKILTSGYVPAYGLIYRGFRIAFHELGFVLLVPGLVLLWRRTLPRGGRVLIGSWLVVVAFFWGVEMLTALQVRYIYFLTPLACIAGGLLLDRLAARGRVARVLAWVVLIGLLIQGSSYWYRGTLEGVMMSVSPLLR
jgi:hypothetical protein